MSRAPLEIAYEIIRRGWRPVPVMFKAKRPIGRGWEKLRIDAESAPRYFNGKPKNVGVMLGEGGPVDVDLDCVEAVKLAPEYLPPTPAIFGRDSKPRSHWIYAVRNPQPTRQHRFGPKLGMIAEHRSTGGQTVYPGSVHESGEEIRWEEEGAPAEVDGVELAAAVERLAAAVRLKRGTTVGKSVTPSTVVSQLACERPSDAFERCRRYLAKVPGAISGQGGHNKTLAAACVCFRFGMSEPEALMLLEEFNKRCEPQWSEAELRHKVADASELVMAGGELGVMSKRGEVSHLEKSRAKVQTRPWHNTLPQWIREIKLRPFQTVILQKIADKCDRKPVDEFGSLGVAITGFEKLATECGMTGRTCKRHVKYLCGMGLLVRMSKGGIRFDTGEVMANTYAIPGKSGALDGVTKLPSIPSPSTGLHDGSVTLCHTVEGGSHRPREAIIWNAIERAQ